MLTPLALRVIPRVRCLNRSSDFRAIVRLMCGPAVKLNPITGQRRPDRGTSADQAPTANIGCPHTSTPTRLLCVGSKTKGEARLDHNQLSIFSARIVARSGTLSIAGRCLNGTGAAPLGPGNKAKGDQPQSFKSPAMWRMSAHWSGTIFRCSVAEPPRKPKSSALDPIDAGPFSRDRTTCLTRRNS